MQQKDIIIVSIPIMHCPGFLHRTEIIIISQLVHGVTYDKFALQSSFTCRGRLRALTMTPRAKVLSLI